MQSRLLSPHSIIPRPHRAATVTVQATSFFRSLFKPMASYTNQKWWTPDTVAVVTGTNKGIGKAIVQLLAGQQLTVVATARNEQAGKETVTEITQALGPNARVVFHPLDIADPQSHGTFKQWLQTQFGGFSILINNGAIAYKGDTFGPQELRNTLSINYYGTASLTESLLPLIKDKEGHVVCVSSRSGLTSILRSDELRQRWLAAKNKQDIDTLLEEFVSLVEKGDDRAMSVAGWPRSMYGVSKLALTSYCRVLAQQVATRGIQVAACCPGYVKTDMSSNRGYKSPEEGADTPVWLALQPNGTLPTGQLWAERAELVP